MVVGAEVVDMGAAAVVEVMVEVEAGVSSDASGLPHPATIRRPTAAHATEFRFTDTPLPGRAHHVTC